jgi:hypothetical protein
MPNNLAMPAFLTALEVALMAVRRAFKRFEKSPVA